MAAALAKFLPYVTESTPGIPDFLSERAVRDACIEFCERTRILVEHMPLNTVIGKSSYHISPPYGVEIHEILSVTNDGAQLTPSNRYEFVREKWDTESGDPFHYYLEGDGSLQLGRIPDAVHTLDIKAVVKPEEDADSVDDVLYSDWRRVIGFGAKAMILGNMDGWMNPQLAEYNRAKFDTGIAKAKLALEKGRSRKPIRVRSHFF